MLSSSPEHSDWSDDEDIEAAQHTHQRTAAAALSRTKLSVEIGNDEHDSDADSEGTEPIDYEEEARRDEEEARRDEEEARRNEDAPASRATFSYKSPNSKSLTLGEALAGYSDEEEQEDQFHFQRLLSQYIDVCEKYKPSDLLFPGLIRHRLAVDPNDLEMHEEEMLAKLKSQLEQKLKYSIENEELFNLISDYAESERGRELLKKIILMEKHKALLLLDLLRPLSLEEAYQLFNHDTFNILMRLDPQRIPFILKLKPHFNTLQIMKAAYLNVEILKALSTNEAIRLYNQGLDINLMLACSAEQRRVLLNTDHRDQSIDLNYSEVVEASRFIDNINKVRFLLKNALPEKFGSIRYRTELLAELFDIAHDEIAHHGLNYKAIESAALILRTLRTMHQDGHAFNKNSYHDTMKLLIGFHNIADSNINYNDQLERIKSAIRIHSANCMQTPNASAAHTSAATNTITGIPSLVLTNRLLKALTIRWR